MIIKLDSPFDQTRKRSYFASSETAIYTVKKLPDISVFNLLYLKIKLPFHEIGH